MCRLDSRISMFTYHCQFTYIYHWNIACYLLEYHMTHHIISIYTSLQHILLHFIYFFTVNSTCWDRWYDLQLKQSLNPYINNKERSSGSQAQTLPLLLFFIHSFLLSFCLFAKRFFFTSCCASFWTRIDDEIMSYCLLTQSIPELPKYQ